MSSYISSTVRGCRFCKKESTFSLPHARWTLQNDKNACHDLWKHFRDQSHQTNTNIRQLNKQTENVAADIQCGHRLLTWTIEPPLWLQFINEVLGTVQQLSVNNNCFNKYQTKWIISSDKESQNSAGKVHGYLCTCQFCFGNQWIILILIILIVILY